MSTVHDVLSAKGNHVYTILETASVLDAVRSMIDKRVGCLVVTASDNVVHGLIAERDVLRRIAAAREDLGAVRVSEVMSKKVAVCSAGDELRTVRSIMKMQYLRQLPVVDGHGHLQGIISSGDVNGYLTDADDLEIKYLHDYIVGRVR